jgi:TonB family protein
VLTALKKNDEAADAQKRLAELLSEKAVVYGGILNGKALVLLQPSYPLAAREARAFGIVQVEVFIDENGNVTAAKATNARKLHPALVQAAEAAARKSRFSPTFVDGAAVKVRGIIVYNFVAR